MNTMKNGSTESTNVQTIIPAVNIMETEGSYVISVDIPGADKENISAKIENATLHVSANIEEEGQETSNVSRRYHREFALATNIDTNHVDAKYELGVLTITLNKKQQYLPKQITIN